MKIYADVPRRRTAQIVADVAMLAWVVGCVLLGRALHDAISALAAPGAAWRARASPSPRP